MATIELYTRMGCPFCHKAKKLLQAKGQTFSEIDLGESPGRFQEMLTRSQGRKTVPEIFIDGGLIGGFDELRRLARTGKLDELLGLQKNAVEAPTSPGPSGYSWAWLGAAIRRALRPRSRL